MKKKRINRSNREKCFVSLDYAVRGLALDEFHSKKQITSMLNVLKKK